MNCCLSADFGGTEIKTRILSETGEFLSPVRHFSANAKADEQTLLSHIRAVLETAIADAPAPLTRAGLAFPGPFDYENGIPLMQGINKYDALYGKTCAPFWNRPFPPSRFALQTTPTSLVWANIISAASRVKSGSCISASAQGLVPVLLKTVRS